MKILNSKFLYAFFLLSCCCSIYCYFSAEKLNYLGCTNTNYMTIIVTMMEVMDERGFQGKVEEVKLPVQMVDVIISEYVYM